MKASRPHILVIGCGSIGRRHAANLVGMNAGTVSVFDTDEQRCRETASSVGAMVVGELDEAWNDADIAVVAAPTQHHIELADQAVRNGCHLFLEKPISYRLDGVDEVCDRIRQADVVDMVACNMRFHPGPMAVRRWIDSGAVGQVLAGRLQTGSYLPTWRPATEYRSAYSADPVWGGAILDCIHEIDLALWYLGPAVLVGAGSTPATAIGLPETDGMAELILRHDSGALCNIHMNFVQRDYRRTCQIIGSEGTIYWDMGEGSVVLYGAEGRVIERSEQPKEWVNNRMYVDQMDHFLHAVRDHQVTMNPLRDAMASLRIALEAKQVEQGVEA